MIGQSVSLSSVDFSFLLLNFFYLLFSEQRQVIIGVVAGFIAILALFLLVVWWQRRQRKNMERTQQYLGEEIEVRLVPDLYHLILRAILYMKLGGRL